MGLFVLLAAPVTTTDDTCGKGVSGSMTNQGMMSQITQAAAISISAAISGVA